MGPKNTDHHFLLKPPHCRISSILCLLCALDFLIIQANKNCYIMLSAKELVQQSLITFEGQTNFSPLDSFLKWPLHIHIAMSLQNLLLIMQWQWFDDGKLDRTWTDKVGTIYSSFQVLDTS